jgi:arylformamidase
VTLPLSERLAVWPGDPPVGVARLGEGLPAVSALSMSSHAGTHVDAPAHFIRGGATVDALPLEILVGRAWVAHWPGPGPITAAAMATAGIPQGAERLLIRTDNSNRADAGVPFDPGFVALAADAADWLLVRGVRLVGIDGPSIEPFIAPGEPVHRALLAAGVVIVEGLALAEIAAGAYELICLPLRIAGCDGAPARVVLMRDMQGQ